MFRFVLASGLLEYDTRRQEEIRQARVAQTSSSSLEDEEEEEGKGKRKKPHLSDTDTDDDDKDTVPSPWANFLAGERLYDPRLTLHISEFAGPKWVAKNPYEVEIVRKTAALVGWEKQIAAMKEVSQGFEDFERTPGEPLRRFDAVLEKHSLPSVMGQVRDYVRTTLRSFSKIRPRFNIWKFATDSGGRGVKVNRRWVSDWDWELTQRRQRASNALLHEDPWQDERNLDVDGECVASSEFLVERFWLWDAKLRFADELRALNQTQASKQMRENGFSAITARKKTTLAPAAVIHTGESLMIIDDTETENEDGANA